MMTTTIKPTEDRVLWLDLETTGLTPETTHILEIGAVVVDKNLYRVDVFQVYIYYDPLPEMDEWCLKTHTASGLLERCKDPDSATPLAHAERRLIKFIDRWFPDNEMKECIKGNQDTIEGRVILAGTGIHFDRRYIRHHLKEVNKRLYHSMIDVSAVHRAMKFFGKPVPEKTSKEVLKHRAIDDIDDSINLMSRLIKS
jgi:oligoribonuclease